MYRKNLPMWERVLRTLVSLTLVVATLIAVPSMLLMVISVSSAVFIIGTGFVGYCPACALVGRKPIQKDHVRHG